MPSEQISPEWVRNAWIDSKAGIIIVELTRAGLKWANARGATSHTLGSSPTEVHSLKRVHREGFGKETRNWIQVEAVEEKTLKLSETTDEGMLLDGDERLIACIIANGSKTAVRIDKIASDFLADRRRLIR